MMKFLNKITLGGVLLASSAYAIVDIAPVEISGKVGVSGNIAASYSEKSGNTEKKEYDGSGKVQYEFDAINMAFVKASVEKTKTNNIETENKSFSHLRYLRKLNNDTLYAEGFIQHKIDTFKEIDLRLLVGGNLRYKILNTQNYGKLYLGLGLFDEEIKHTNGSSQDDISVIRVNSYIAYTNQITDSTKFNMNGYFQPSTEDIENKYSSLLAELEVKIIKKLSLNISYEYDHNSNPPIGVDKTDTVMKTSLMYSF